MEFIQMFRYGMRIHFNVRESLGVALEVDLQVAFGRESIAANVAFERPFTRVRSDVNLKCRIAAKHFTTIAATMFEEECF